MSAVATAAVVTPLFLAEPHIFISRKNPLTTRDRVTLADLADLFALREGQDRVLTDVSDLARAATYGQIETLTVDIDEIVWGTVDDEGAIAFADEGTEGAYDIVDEIVRRVLAADGRVLAVRTEDVYGDGAAAAVLRYPWFTGA